MRIILVCLQFKYSNWLDNKEREKQRRSEREKVMAKYEARSNQVFCLRLLLPHSSRRRWTKGINHEKKVAWRMHEETTRSERAERKLIFSFPAPIECEVRLLGLRDEKRLEGGSNRFTHMVYGSRLDVFGNNFFFTVTILFGAAREREREMDRIFASVLNVAEKSGSRNGLLSSTSTR